MIIRIRHGNWHGKMNRFAYRTTGLAVKAIENISRARVNIHDPGNIPPGSNIFVINHFTRVETFLLPTYLNKLTQTPIWSLAAAEFFQGTFGKYMENLGAVSTKNPDRDRLIVKSLLTGEAMWMIFPEGRMVKNKKIIEKGRFMISSAGGKHPPHTGAATLALRTEFYRQRLLKMNQSHPDEAKRLLERFEIESMEEISENQTNIVPVNVTYYPLRAKENALSNLASSLLGNISERLVEELMTEGSMLISGVDMDIRFGKPIAVDTYLKRSAIKKDIQNKAAIQFDDILPSRKLMRKAALEIMQRYMTAIYSMTTINHDHLFASMLKLMPFSRVNIDDLKRRVFLAASSGIEKMNVYCHQGLQEDQTHLLVDDRYNKYKDFISFSLEKGCLKQKENTLIKVAKIGPVFDFHNARIKNPISVIANEVEPMKEFLRVVRRIAWQPGAMIRKKIANKLIEKALDEYAADYEAFYVEGESKRRVGMPFLAKGKSKKIGVVLSHGYMAAPEEVRGLAIYLQKKGFWVYAPRLKGHGTSPEDLAVRTYQDWLRSVENGYAIIRSICDKVVIGGFSTGAGLSLHLAGRVEDVAGVFAVSAPLRLQDLGARFAPALDAWNRLMDKYTGGSAKKEFVENNPENPHINYHRNPISGVRELERLMEAMEPLLPKIEIPAFVVQSEGDPVVNPKGSKKIFNQLGSKDKKYSLFNFDRHGILLGEGAERVYGAIGEFIEQLK
jgi:esterase/lipase/1-acyl-sn-glycerol-3-phosphate acyltransferase